MKTYTNNTKVYQLVGNCNDVVMSGEKKEVIKKMESIEIANSKWAILHVVAPSETVNCNLTHNTEEIKETINIEDLWGVK